MITDFKIYVSDALTAQKADRQLHDTETCHQFQGKDYVFMVCSGVTHTMPNAFLVDDSFIRDNKDAFIEAAIDASTCIILGVCGEYKRLAARNGLNGVLGKYNHLYNEVRKEFLQSLNDKFANIQQKVDELYCCYEPKKMRLGLSSLSNDFENILQSSEYRRDQNPKILRPLISYYATINALKGTSNGIYQLFQKAASTGDINHVFALYDLLDCLRKMIQSHKERLGRDLHTINQALSKTSTLE
ncbi:hypothetical protein H105_07934 [Trichophyton soudanense CBS 452.61]|uniref:Uncharacterized protein n=1 Tax=Trichophyton soudanense CBS 452.61 TaxID=1215331 RepID=A0A022XH08_TRISD|nr:hypothetical protein H105_07934 [Trichophyton soudanense CBS 452.61]EZG02206.1 hypothetical protein H106_07775 [Trichophyton rubrum CBS 735.88]